MNFPIPQGNVTGKSFRVGVLAWAAIMKYHRPEGGGVGVRGLTIAIYFLMCWRLSSLRSQFQDDSVLVRALFLASGWFLCPHRALPLRKCREKERGRGGGKEKVGGREKDREGMRDF